MSLSVRSLSAFVIVCGVVSCAKSAPPPPGTAAKIGETVTFADSEWTVLDAKNLGQHVRRNDPAVEPRTTDGAFVQIHYRVTNTGEKEERLLDAPRVVDARGRQFGRIELEAFYVPSHTTTVGVLALPPRQGKEYWTVIEVPADAKGLKLELHGLGLFGDKKLVDLGM